MSISWARLRLFSGNCANQKSIRSPWAIPESSFDNICGNCGDGISARPQLIVHSGREHLPGVGLARSESWPRRISIIETGFSRKAGTLPNLWQPRQFTSGRSDKNLPTSNYSQEEIA